MLRTAFELVGFMGLRVIAALVAQAFMRLLSFGERCFREGSLPLLLRPALGGLLAGGVAAVLPQVAGNGYEPLNALLDARFSTGFVVLLLIGKAVATTASVSSGSPGGVFTPGLLLGGCVGFLYAMGLDYATGATLGPAGRYALIGMAAATAATTHAPLMAAVMVFELSGDYAIVLPLLVASGATAWASLTRLRCRSHRRLAPSGDEAFCDRLHDGKRDRLGAR